MSTFFVPGPMRECSPLMIGGSESTRSAASMTTGYTGDPSRMGKNFLRGELLAP